ncbi:hypothetical protein BBP00_00004058 [Phytophthora kernoviae]|uniref:Uncharacterized protein n=1 Tax=Phytophthora kernoviae TaxID=325452 RepID=A0A3F2RST7_9STRA|nr:hypothetical protein BBP00_00004058 [Phytophthora kernoviae]
MMVEPTPRSGKWTRPEEKFIDGILCEFDRQALPLAHGTPIRLVLAKLLNCSTMRLSKKFQKNALVFRQELVDQFRRENNTDEGALVETQNLRCAVQQFWVSNFLKFAVLVGQPVMGLDVSDAKKRKHASQLLRAGKFDELLSWYHHPSPANTTSVSPMPPMLANPSGDSQVNSGPWSTGAAMYSSSALGQTHQDNGPTIPTLLQQVSQSDQHMLRPVKKMRTPEGNVEASRFGLQPPPMEQTGATYSHYGRPSPPATSPFDYAHAQSQQHQQLYSSEYARPSTTYSPYADEVKAEKTAMGYANVQQQQMQSAPVRNEAIAHGQRSEYAPTTYQGAPGMYVGGAGQPWDELLENVPASATNANAGVGAPAATNESSSYQGGNSSMQSWPNNPHML